MVDIVRSEEQSFRDSRGATAALMTPAARWEFSFRQTGRGHAFVRPPYSIAPANYEKSWSILPYYAPFLGPRETTWLPSSEDNFARRYSLSILSSGINVEEYCICEMVFISSTWCIFFNWNNQCCSMHVFIRHRIVCHWYFEVTLRKLFIVYVIYIYDTCLLNFFRDFFVTNEITLLA